MDHGTLPAGLELVRTTDPFDHDSVPAGLLRAHHLAADVHGRIRVLAGHVRFVWEDEEAAPVSLAAGDTLVIPPEVRHHVELDPGARFLVEFHR